jgi:hypothetical protein
MMGPFTFNAATQSWTNVNNGMRISNAEFQNMMSSGDYTTNSSDSGTSVIVVPSGPGWQPSNFSINFLNISGITMTSNIGSGSIAQSSNYTVSGNTSGTRLKIVNVSGSSVDRLINEVFITFSLNNGIYRQYTVYNTIEDSQSIPIFPPSGTISSGATFAFRSTAPSWFLGSNTYGFKFFNTLDGNSACSNTFYINLNVGATSTSQITSSDMSSVVGGNLTAAGATYFVAPVATSFLVNPVQAFATFNPNPGPTFFTSVDNPGFIANIPNSGQNIPINIKAIVLTSTGVSLARILGGTGAVVQSEQGANTPSNYYNLLTTGVTLGFRQSTPGITEGADYLTYALVLPSSTGASGSGTIQLRNTTAGVSFGEVLSYSYDNNYYITNTPSFGSLTGGSVNQTVFAANGGCVFDVGSAQLVTLTNFDNNTELGFSVSKDNAVANSDSVFPSIVYSLNGKGVNTLPGGGKTGPNPINYDAKIGVQKNDTLKIGIINGPQPLSGLIKISNFNALQVLEYIPYSYT